MKTFLKWTKITIVVTIIYYAAFAFVFDDMDASMWHIKARFSMIWLIAFTAGGVKILKDLLKN